MNIIYLSYGGPKYYNQTRFSVLSLLKLIFANDRNDINIFVYTDAPETVPKHPLINVKLISKDTIKSYRGRFDYVHRTKLKVLEKAYSEVSLPFVYVDCDTFWNHIPDEIFNTLSSPVDNQKPPLCMHCPEGVYSQSWFSDYLQAIETNTTELSKLGLTQFQGIVSWNAGVIGLSKFSPNIFTQTLLINDFLFTRVKKRTWVEQLALSLVGCNQFNMIPLGEALNHYWGYSYGVSRYLADFFSKISPSLSIEEQAKLCTTENWSEQEFRTMEKGFSHQLQRKINKFHNSNHKRKVDLQIFFSKLMGWV